MREVNKGRERGRRKARTERDQVTIQKSRIVLANGIRVQEERAVVAIRRRVKEEESRRREETKREVMGRDINAGEEEGGS